MGDKFEATGKVYLVNAAETRGNFTFRKFVVEIADNPKYPQLVEFQTTRDGIGKLDNVSIGDEVRVTFNLRGREWRSPQGEMKYFNTLDCWKIDVTQAATVAPRSAASAPASAAPPIDDSDIPF